MIGKGYLPVGSSAWKDENPNKLKLDWNEKSDLISKSIKEDINKFLDSKNASFYPDVNDDKLLLAISNYCQLSKENILITPGSDYAHEVLLKYIAKERGGRVLIFGPTYDNFRSASQTIVSETKIELLPLRDYNLVLDFDYSVADLVYFVSPNNPTGNTVKKDILSELLAKWPNTIFLIDEAYIDFNITESVSQLVNEYENIIISRTFSKAFSLAAFRIGYLISNPKMISELYRFTNVKHVNALAKIAAQSVLNNLDLLNEHVLEIKTNMNLVAAFLKKKCQGLIDTIEGKGNFILLEFDSPKRALNFVDILKTQSVYIRSLAHLNGYENYVRITIPSKDNLKIFFKVIENVNEIIR